jgi:hypothetical protein
MDKLSILVLVSFFYLCLVHFFFVYSCLIPDFAALIVFICKLPVGERSLLGVSLWVVSEGPKAVNAG